MYVYGCTFVLILSLLRYALIMFHCICVHFYVPTSPAPTHAGIAYVHMCRLTWAVRLVYGMNWSMSGHTNWPSHFPRMPTAKDLMTANVQIMSSLCVKFVRFYICCIPDAYVRTCAYIYHKCHYRLAWGPPQYTTTCLWDGYLPTETTITQPLSGLYVDRFHYKCSSFPRMRM